MDLYGNYMEGLFEEESSRPAGESKTHLAFPNTAASMPRRAQIRFVPLRSSHVNLPMLVYGPLLECSIISLCTGLHRSPLDLFPSPASSNLAVHINFRINSRNGSSPQLDMYVGWTRMASASSLTQFNSADAEKVGRTIEMDPQYAMALGLSQGYVVR